MKFLAIESGTSALNLAVARGDVEIVKILLDYGADPYVENDLGMNAFEICDMVGPFPSVRNVLEEHSGRDQVKCKGNLCSIGEMICIFDKIERLINRRMYR
tara:strand:+ start:279 stop:581 length:303 start_codon:yes stop_codon:yes gene_type:complete